MTLGPLDGVLVVALEQAVAAPLASSRLAEAGARVIKVERPEGDFARGYDRYANGVSSYFPWLNRGTESIALDLREPADREPMERAIARADVFIQNLSVGATGRLGGACCAVRSCSAFGVLNEVAELATHPQLRLAEVAHEVGAATLPASPVRSDWPRVGPAPALDEHGDRIRREFAAT